VKISAEKPAVLVCSNNALALNADAARTTSDLARHVLVGVRAGHVSLWILANLDEYRTFTTTTTTTAVLRPLYGTTCVSRVG